MTLKSLLGNASAAASPYAWQKLDICPAFPTRPRRAPRQPPLHQPAQWGELTRWRTYWAGLGFALPSLGPAGRELRCVLDVVLAFLLLGCLTLNNLKTSNAFVISAGEIKLIQKWGVVGCSLMLWQWRLCKCEKFSFQLKLGTSVGLLFSKADGEKAALPSAGRSRVLEELNRPCVVSPSCRPPPRKQIAWMLKGHGSAETFCRTC